MDAAGHAALGQHLQWLRLRGDAVGSIGARRRTVRRLAFSLGCPLLEATPEQLLHWRAGLQLAPVTVCSYVSHVRQFYAWALKEGLIYINPAAELPVPRRPRCLPRPINEHDLLSALVCAPPQIRPWLVLAGWAGLRAKEIALLRREHVLELAPQPVIRIVATATKGTTERLIPMCGFVVEEVVPVLPAQGWCFARADGRSGPNHPAVVSHRANDHLHACGLTATLHMLRHRFGTQMYRTSGHDLRAVQEALGHLHSSSTDGYAAYDQLSAAAAVEAIPAPRRPRQRAG